VFAYNGQGCTASASVTAVTKPGVITDLFWAGPSANGQVFDFTVTGGEMGTTPITSDFTLYYRLNGSTEYGPVTLGAFLKAEPLQYGSTVSVTVRACRTYSGQQVCQDTASAPFALGVPVDPRASGVVFTHDLVDNPETEEVEAEPVNSGTFQISGWPVGSYEDVQLACGIAPGDGAFTSIVGPSPTCHVDAGPTDTPYLTIRGIANGGQIYDISYNGFDYD
jgi:hypothetical protein